MITGYEIYRAEEVIDSQLKLNFARLLHITNAETTIYTDTETGPGKYYYAVFARYNDGTVDINFAADTNYTRYPVMIVTLYRITAMESSFQDGKVTIKWNFTGNSGNDTVTIFKTDKCVRDSGALMPDSVIATANINTGSFTFEAPPEGLFYYGLYLKNENHIVPFTTGINITSLPIGHKKEKKEETAADDKADVQDQKEEPLEIEKENLVVPEKEQKKEIVRHRETVTPELDYIISNYFYREEYGAAVKELNLFISETDNEYERAKARLYLARTYIELEEFSKSVKLLNMKDVRNFFPKEAEFWAEFATARLR